jgi:hypothetical protein
VYNDGCIAAPIFSSSTSTGVMWPMWMAMIII